MESKVENIGNENLSPLRKAVLDIMDNENDGNLETAVLIWKSADEEQVSYYYVGKKEVAFYLTELIKFAILTSTMTGDDNPFGEERTYIIDPQQQGEEEEGDDDDG